LIGWLANSYPKFFTSGLRCHNKDGIRSL
jgi:hypothetical protein